MAYVTAKDLRAVVPDQYRDAALSDSGATPDPGLLQAVIDAACQEVDALIEGRVRLPLSSVPSKIKTAATYLALEILFVRRGVDMPAAMAGKISWWRTWLSKVGAGELRIEAPADEDTSAAALSTQGAIVVRPVVTGTGGLIGALLFLLAFLARPAAGIDARTYDFIAPTNPLIESADFMEWSQAESVRLRYRLAAADATREARWEISDATNLWLNEAPVRSGAVWSWNPAPTQTCLPAGRYVGRVAVYARSGTNLTFHRILAFQDVRVHEARDPQNLVFASPLDTLAPVWFDVVQGNLAAHVARSNNPHGVTAAQIGALTAESDAAGLAAAASVQSNLAEHAAKTNNPHGVTAAQIGALMSENDPAFFAWEPSAHVPVVCAGGWLFPDFFRLQTTPYSDVGVSYGPTSAYNSIQFTWQTVTPQKGEVLSAEIIHQQDWSTAVSYTSDEVLEIRELDGTFYADWPDGTPSGTVGRVVARLGDFSRTLELTCRGASAAISNAWWTGDVAGSFRAAVNVAVSNRAWAANKEASLFSPWPYSTTNPVFTRNTNCWVAGINFTCASPWNSYRYPYWVNGIEYQHNDRGNYHAGTAITPQHFIYASHFAVATNTTFRWIDSTNGVHDRTLVDQRFLGNDIALGLLDAPLPAEIAPAKCLGDDAISYLRGMYGLKNALGFRVVGLDAHEMAWLYASPFMERVADAWQDAFYLSGSTNVPFSRSGAVGGDSGNPIFLTEGTNVVLLSTFWTPQSGPFLPAFRADIEAAMVEMGGSIYTNWPAADLSAWTNYDAGLELPEF